MGNGENDVVELELELEAMRRGDENDALSSWHPCRLQLCSTGMGLIVLYEDRNSEEIISDKEKVLERVRVRSTPLQADDCSSIQQGDRVLAPRNSHSNRIFCDATVKEFIRVRHSKRTHCRCSLIVKWLYQAHEGDESTVPASTIMKLSTKSVTLHPVISAFLRMQESLSGLNTPPLPTIVDSLELEMDIDLLLDKQIREISNSTVVSRTKFSQNILFGLEAGPNEQVHDRETDASLKDQCTGHEDEQPMETAKANFTAISSVEEKFTESRSSVNPLAARAALALIRSNFPPIGHSFQSDIERGNIISEHTGYKFLDGDGYHSFSAVSSITVDISSDKAANFGAQIPKYEGIVKTLFPTSSASNVPSRAQGEGTKKKSRNSENHRNHSEMRLTRGQLRRSTEKMETAQMTISEETLLGSSNKRRKANSTTDNADTMEVMEVKTTSENNAAIHFHKSDSFLLNSISSGKQVASPIDGHSKSADQKIPLNKGGMICDTIKANNSKRQTRAAVRKETEKNIAQSELHLENETGSESNPMGEFEGNVASENSLLKPDKSILSPASMKTSTRSTKKREKNCGTCVTVMTTPKSSEHAISSSQGKERNSVGSKKQERRFSPRLGFLPRTRSQKKG